jgi:hypothetical protein
LQGPEGKLGTIVLFSTHLDFSAEQIINYFVRRWAIEVTFQEVSAHLGVEIPKQWSAKAIARSTLIIIGIFSLVTLIADRSDEQDK